MGKFLPAVAAAMWANLKTVRTVKKFALAISVVLAVAVVAVCVFFATLPERRFDRGMVYYEWDDYDSAAACFSSAIKLNPQKAKYRYWKGRARHKSGDYAEAIEEYTEAIRLEPGNAKAYAHRGGAYYDRFDTEDDAKALADFYQSFALSPDYAAAAFPDTNRSEPRDAPKLYLSLIITDSVVTIGAKGGFMPSLWYREFHRYVTKDGLDTMIRYMPHKRPINPRTGKAFTESERAGIDLYVYEEDGQNDYKMYTKSGELLTAIHSNSPVDRVDVGDTVYAVANGRNRTIIVSDPDEFERRPFSAYDDLMNRLMLVQNRYYNAEDADRILIAITDGLGYETI